MSDEFKRMLETYEKGELKGEELKKFEKELAKLELYQELLENDTIKEKLPINEKKQKKILRRSKWKARFQTALLALGIFIGVMIVSTVLTAIYYSWGTPDRSEVFADIIDYTLAVTDPHGSDGGTSTNVKPFFMAEMTRDLNKRVGSDRIKTGELTVNFLFSLMSFPDRELGVNHSTSQLMFTFPGFGERMMSDWDRLEKLPEGTVATAYISFNKLLETSDIFEQFAGRDLDISWLAVDTGVEGNDEQDYGVVFAPIGFPSTPIWHEDDMKLENREETKGFLFGKIVSESHSSPDYEEGDTEILHTQFIKTLKFLEKHEKKAEKLYEGRLNLQERLEFIEKQGIKNYGMVVTGPTKEILELKDMDDIESIEVDEIGFWNWH